MEEKKDEERIRKGRKVLSYSGIGFQMLVTILLFVFLGKKLDEYLANESAVWTLVGTLTGLLVGLYFMIKGFMDLKD